MARKNDDIDDIIEKRVEQGIKGLAIRIIAVCVTATSAMIGIFYQIGGWIYNHWHPIQEAFRAFYEANKP